MTEISKINRMQAKENPEAEFNDPIDIARCKGLTRAEKITALEEWRFILERRLEAAGEGMTERLEGAITADAALMREVVRQLDVVKQNEGDALSSRS